MLLFLKVFYSRVLSLVVFKPRQGLSFSTKRRHLIAGFLSLPIVAALPLARGLVRRDGWVLREEDL